MTFLIIDGERYALTLEQTTLGGGADEVLRHSPLAALTPFAIIALDESGTTVRAIPGGEPVLVNGEPLGQGQRALRHGDTLGVGRLTMHVGDIDKAGRTDHVSGVTDAQLLQHEGLPIADPTAATGGRLTALSDGRAYTIPAAGLLIGRDPDCHVVLGSLRVSRRHARVVPGLLGYSLLDDSTNGVVVNGLRVDRSVVLNQGDIVAIGEEVFRFTADTASYEPDQSIFAGTPVPLRATVPAPPLPTVPTETTPRAKRPVQQAGQEGAKSSPPLLATLEVTGGTIPAGTVFRVERVVVQIGRSAPSDIRLLDESVSGTHASLVHRDGHWQLIDLGSRNGTYVEGRRITECVLTGVCEIRFGALHLRFRPIRSAAEGSIGTLGVFGVGADRETK